MPPKRKGAKGKKAAEPAEKVAKETPEEDVVENGGAGDAPAEDAPEENSAEEPAAEEEEEEDEAPAKPAKKAAPAKGKKAAAPAAAPVKRGRGRPKKVVK